MVTLQLCNITFSTLELVRMDIDLAKFTTT